METSLRDPLLESSTKQQDDNDTTNKNSSSDNNNNTSTPVWLVCGVKCRGGGEEGPEDNIWSTTLVNMILPILLWVQFALAFENPHNTIETSNMDFGWVQLQVLLFVVTGVLFRKTLTGHEPVLLQVFPEIVSDLILLLILLQNVAYAVVTLQLFGLTFFIYSLWNVLDRNQRDIVDKAIAESLDVTHHDRTPLKDGDKDEEEEV